MCKTKNSKGELYVAADIATKLFWLAFTNTKYESLDKHAKLDAHGVDHRLR